MKALKHAVNRGVLVAVTTQCHSGGVHDIYATGRLLKELGCVHTGDMTIECIIAKLAYLFGKGYELSVIKKLLKRNMKGEITKDKHRFKH
jgi:L-asparaginase/Glu-tRNA(Gln) amidotransferase subunit D